MSDEINFQRKSDLDNINKIPEIMVHVEYIKQTIDTINLKIQDYGEVKSDVVWLKRFFWALTTSSITALVISVFGIILKK